MEVTAEHAIENSKTSTATAKNPGDENSLQTKIESLAKNESSKKTKKEDKTKKDDKNVEQFMKSLNSVPSLEEKLSLVCKKYVQAADDNKKLQFYIKQSDKRYAMLGKEKEQLQHEFNKTILIKSRLEDLCRELQKQNKAIKEESLLKIREEEERRKETQGKFQSTLAEITTLLHQNNEKNSKLRDDNVNMTEKFKSIVTQYQLREQQVEKLTKQMALENQLADTKLQKASLEHQAEKGRLLAELETVRMQLATSEARVEEMRGAEGALRGQLAVYTDKYDEFQAALVKSNQVFGGFKGEMEKMSKKISSLETEALQWKRRWETSQAALIEVCSEREARDQAAAAAAAAAARHLAHMQALCRALQAERTVLVSTLKEHNIERPPAPAPVPAPAPAPAPAPTPASQNNDKVEAMAANCAQLKQSLAQLQSQLNVLTNNSGDKQTAAATAEDSKPEKSRKKSKNKKNQQPAVSEIVPEKSKPTKEPEDKPAQESEMDKPAQESEMDKPAQESEKDQSALGLEKDESAQEPEKDKPAQELEEAAKQTSEVAENKHAATEPATDPAVVVADS